MLVIIINQRFSVIFKRSIYEIAKGKSYFLHFVLIKFPNHFEIFNQKVHIISMQLCIYRLFIRSYEYTLNEAKNGCIRREYALASYQCVPQNGPK